MTFDELTQAVDSGEVDTVLLALTDMQGRLQGKRFHARHFVDAIATHGAEACNYLLAVDVEMNTVSGYAMSSWERGYGDFEMRPDLDTIRRITWHESTVMVLSDLVWADGSPVAPSPRQVLRGQIDRLAGRGWKANVGTELEFILFRTTYEEAHAQAYRDLDPANQYNVDYSLLGTARVEPLLRRVRNAMYDAELHVENSKGECNFGQHEINFRYQDALRTCDEHVLFKNGIKEIAAQDGMSVTFMAKFDQREGSSCHIHISLAREDGSSVFADEAQTFDHFVAGLVHTLPEMTYFLAPNVNSYKRFAEGSFAPTVVAWGEDNRTCSLRVVGHGPARRVECRLGGADLNPYLAVAAVIAGGLHGIDEQLPLEPALEGNAYTSGRPRVPGTLHDARDLLSGSAVLRSALGDDVIEHYLNNASVEIAAFDAAVTDWERFRGFERL